MSDSPEMLEAINAANAAVAKIQQLDISESEVRALMRARAVAIVEGPLKDYRQWKQALLKHFEDGSICFRTTVPEVANWKDGACRQLLNLSEEYARAKRAYVRAMDEVPPGTLTLDEPGFEL